VGVNPTGYHGAVFDGRHVYFGPYGDEQQHGEVLRYDAGLPIPATSEWGVIMMGILILTAGTVVFQLRQWMRELGKADSRANHERRAHAALRRH
jgi:hypothetical protein